jgi:hypothetical protein
MTPWSGRQMTSFISQSKPRNTHLVQTQLDRVMCQGKIKGSRRGAQPGVR